MVRKAKGRDLPHGTQGTLEVDVPLKLIQESSSLRYSFSLKDLRQPRSQQGCDDVNNEAGSGKVRSQLSIKHFLPGCLRSKLLALLLYFLKLVAARSTPPSCLYLAFVCHATGSKVLGACEVAATRSGK